MLNAQLVAEYNTMVASIAAQSAALSDGIFGSDIFNASPELRRLVMTLDAHYVEPIVSHNASKAEIARVERAIRKALAAVSAVR